MSRPVPSLGRTLTQQRAMDHYIPMAEQARRDRELSEHEQRRADEIHAALQVDALMARVRSAGTGECAAPDESLTWSDVIGLFAADITLTALFLAGWFLFGIGGASLYFLICGSQP